MEDRFPFIDVDRELLLVAKDVKLLSVLSWPAETSARFLECWRAGRPELPSPPPVKTRNEQRIEALERLARPVADHPIARFIARTAASYLLAVRMLAAAGTPVFTELSGQLFGRPTDPLVSGGMSTLEAAVQFVDATGELALACEPEPPGALTSDEVADILRAQTLPFFTEDDVRIVLDAKLASKAAAGAEQIRVRGDTLFTENDVRVLVEHEAFVHSATALNGRRQPALQALSLGAPRTTATQEGIATFAEFITGAMDLLRLRRLALRVTAIQAALDGADFIAIFRLFLEAGQSETESFHSAQRVFRGGDVRGGGICFTKDAVYLRGLLTVHTFLHAALAARRPEFTWHLFAGRLTCGDILELDPLFANGVLREPLYAPRWLRSTHNLTAYLAFSTLTHGLPIRTTHLDAFAAT